MASYNEQIPKRRVVSQSLEVLESDSLGIIELQLKWREKRTAQGDSCITHK
jgi:hypothetical protein